MTQLTLERTECPSCAAGIDFDPRIAAGRLRCATCGAVLDREDLSHIATYAAGGFEPDSKIEIGWTLKRDGTWRVTGRLRYTHSFGHWDEWVMLGDDGQLAYLEECEGDYRWLTAFTPSLAPVREVPRHHRPSTRSMRCAVTPS